MSIILAKGQKIDLKKSTDGELRKVIVGLGWDEAQPQKSGGLLGSLFGGKKKGNIDCDASVFVCQDGKIAKDNDIVYFGRLSHESGAVQHMGDNLTGAGDGDDERIIVTLDQLPQKYDKIVFVANIFQARQRNQHFGMIQNAFIRICDADTNQELCKYNLSENYDNMTAMIFGEIYRHNGQWKFNAIGQGTTDDTVQELANRFH